MRRINRQRVFKAGKIIFGEADTTVDCLIRDESPAGLLVETDVFVEVPERVKIKIINGGTFLALRRWALGNKIGLEFIGDRIYDSHTLVTMQGVLEVLQTHGIQQAVQSLRIARFFYNEDIEEAAKEAEAATKRLEALLSGKSSAVASDLHQSK
jgi:hypothetical protein